MAKPMVLVMVGLPGSGKSTFSETLMKSKDSWTRVCQDVLKSKDKCERVTRDSLARGLSVVIDRTNLSPDQRSTWCQIAQDVRVRCDAVAFTAKKEDCIRRCAGRVNHEGGVTAKGAPSLVGRMANDKGISFPALIEGFTAVHEVVCGEASAEADVTRVLAAMAGGAAGVTVSRYPELWRPPLKKEGSRSKKTGAAEATADGPRPGMVRTRSFTKSEAPAPALPQVQVAAGSSSAADESRAKRSRE